MPLSLLNKIAVAACVAELDPQAPDTVLLIPAGEFRARDGRPVEVPAWRMNAKNAQLVIATAQKAKGDFVIDYEHQTLKAAENGKPAPAAGWWKGAKLEWRDGVGLVATNIDWTDAARAAIAAREYRYLSPVFIYSKKTGDVEALLMAALTNYPAIDGHGDLAAAVAARFSPQEENHVDKTKLIAALGLAADATDAQIEQALAALKARADSVAAKDTEIAALKAATPDPAKFAPVATMQALQTDVATLRAQLVDKEVGDLVRDAVTAGKLLPAQEAWARELGKKDVAALKGYLDTAQPIAALKGTQTGGKGPEDKPGELSESELAVCKAMGLSTDEFKKSKEVK